MAEAPALPDGAQAGARAAAEAALAKEHTKAATEAVASLDLEATMPDPAHNDPLRRRPFVLNTFRMVSDPATDAFISWDEDGSSFTVHEPGVVGSHVLNKYFKHSNFSSFVRQLNSYAFHKINPDRWQFAHPDFRRDEPERLHKLVRRSSSRSGKDKHAAADDTTGAVPPGLAALPTGNFQHALLELGSYGGDAAASGGAAIAPWSATAQAAAPASLQSGGAIIDVTEAQKQFQQKMSQVQRDRDMLKEEVHNLRSRLVETEAKVTWQQQQLDNVKHMQESSSRLNEWIVSVLAKFPGIREGMTAGTFPPMPAEAKQEVMRIGRTRTRKALQAPAYDSTMALGSTGEDVAVAGTSEDVQAGFDINDMLLPAMPSPSMPPPSPVILAPSPGMQPVITELPEQGGLLGFKEEASLLKLREKSPPAEDRTVKRVHRVDATPGAYGEDLSMGTPEVPRVDGPGHADSLMSLPSLNTFDIEGLSLNDILGSNGGQQHD